MCLSSKPVESQYYNLEWFCCINQWVGRMRPSIIGEDRNLSGKDTRDSYKHKRREGIFYMSFFSSRYTVAERTGKAPEDWRAIAIAVKSLRALPRSGRYVWLSACWVVEKSGRESQILKPEWFFMEGFRLLCDGQKILRW